MIIDSGTPRAHFIVSAHMSADERFTPDQIELHWASATWRLCDDHTWLLEEFVISGKASHMARSRNAGRKWARKPGYADCWQQMPADVRPIAEALRPGTFGVTTGQASHA